MRNAYRSHRGLVSALGGLIVALLLVAFAGGSTTSPVGVALAAVLGIVFAGAMFAAGHERRLPPSN